MKGNRVKTERGARTVRQVVRAMDEACTPYLETIGIASWEEIIHREPIR